MNSTLRSRRNNLSREVRFASHLRSPCNESFGLPDYAVTLSSYPKYEAKSIPFPTWWFVHLHPLFVCDARSRDSLLHRNLDSIAFSRVRTHANIIYIYIFQRESLSKLFVWRLIVPLATRRVRVAVGRSMKKIRACLIRHRTFRAIVQRIF